MTVARSYRPFIWKFAVAIADLSGGHYIFHVARLMRESENEKKADTVDQS